MELACPFVVLLLQCQSNLCLHLVNVLSFWCFHRESLLLLQYPSYINVNSDHPKTIIKQIPKAVKLRIRSLSTNEKIFQESSKIYKEALENIGFREGFTFQEENLPNDKSLYINKENKKYSQNNRKRKIIWLNPPLL